MPQGFFRFASVCGAGTAPSETSAVAVNDCTLFDSEPPQAKRLATAALPATMLNTLSRDFMTALLTRPRVNKFTERAATRLYSLAAELFRGARWACVRRPVVRAAHNGQ